MGLFAMFSATRALSSRTLLSTSRRGIKLIPRQHLQDDNPEGPFLFSRKSWKRGSYKEEGWEIPMLLCIVPITATLIYVTWIRPEEDRQDDIHSWAQQEIAARRQVLG